MNEKVYKHRGGSGLRAISFKFLFTDVKALCDDSIAIEMADSLSTVKKTVRKVKKDTPASKSLLQCVSTPLASSNSGRLSLLPNARLQKVTSNSLERLTFISEKEDNSDIDNYLLEYSKYLLRKVQNRVLISEKAKKEENVKKCFVSLKLELEDLLNKYVQLSKDIGYFKIHFDILNETSQKIESAKKILTILKENDFESLLKSLSSSLDHTVNQLQLIDVDIGVIDEAFRKKVWGSGSELEECLKKIDSHIEKNKDGVSKIATELVEIKKICLENTVLKERFYSVFEKISNEILDTNYELFTNVVKKAFLERENSKDEFIQQSLNCDLGFLTSGTKSLNNQQDSLQISQSENLHPEMPNSASTPQPK